MNLKHHVWYCLCISFIIMALPVSSWAGIAQRIVSLSPSATEILFAIGAGKQVVAVDNQSNYPPQAPVMKLSAYQPSLEAIVSYEPDMVVITFDVIGIKAGLQTMGVKVIHHTAATSLDDMYRQIAELGAVSGHETEADQLSEQIKTDLAQTMERIPIMDNPLRIYHEVDAAYYSVSSASFLGQIYQQLGLINIADAADRHNSGYPQLSVEYILQANPQLIVITDQSGYNSADVLRRPGWQFLDASRQGRIIQVNADIASRWGPRVVEFVRLVVANIQP